MRKLVKMIIALVAVGSLMFVGTSPASADTLKKPGNGSSVSSTHKADKTKKKDKKTKKAKKAKKAGKKAKKAKKAGKNGKRVANFAPVADPTPTNAPACDPDVEICDPVCDPAIDVCDQPCDPMIDKLCQLIDPTCDPAVDVWCEIVVDPTCDPTVDTCDPIIDPTATEEPTVDPTPTEEPTVDPYPTWENNSAAWNTYFDSVSKANSDYMDFVAAAQADFDAATVDAKTARDEAIAAATTFAEVVKAVKDFRIATEVQRAQLDTVLKDAQEAVNILVSKAYDKLIADGGLIVFKCGDRERDHAGGKIHIDPMPPAPDTASPAPRVEGKPLKGHKKHGHK